MENLGSLDWPLLLDKLKSFATSERAKIRLSETRPLKNETEAIYQFREIEEARDILSNGVRPFMESLDLFSFWFDRVRKGGVLKNLEFRDARLFCLEAIALREALKTHSRVWSKRILIRLMDAERPLAAIDQILTPSGDVRTDASETLHRLYQNKLDLERNIRLQLDRLVKSHQMESLLQDRYVTNREGRWVLPIRSGQQHSLDGIIHDSSQTKQTVFMEPQVIVKINNDLRQNGIDIENEIEKLLTQLSKFLASMAPEFERTFDALLESDIRFAQGQLAQILKASSTEFKNDSIRLKDLKHPLLILQNPENVIGNTIEIEQGVLLLSGPNAGGKTVLLKAIGLCAHMARCGLLVPCAPGSTVPFFKRLFIAVGDAQSVDAHLSTFAAHLIHLSEAAQANGPQDLILVDEICGSTDPEEGAALARSFVEHYASSGAFGVITSHLGPLKEGWDKDSRVLSGSMEYSDETNRATYQLLIGVHGRSLALRTARRVGVPSEIVDRALEFMSPEARARDQKLAELEQHKQEILNLKVKLSEDQKKAHEEREKYMALVDRFKRDRDVWLQKTIAQGEKKIEALISEMKEQKNKSAEDIKFELPQIVRSSPRPQIQTAEDFARAFPPGTMVFVPTLNQEAVIQSAPNSKGEVQILSNSMRLTLHWQKLQVPKHNANPTQSLARKAKGVTFTGLAQERVLDLRGKRVEEALEELEVQLDAATHAQEERVKVIHGHGTEALKKAIRSYLSRSVYVKRWQAGDGEAGDGYTWIELQ